MTDECRVWIPHGARPGTEHVLAVPHNKLDLDPSLYLDLLQAKLAELIQAHPTEARSAMEMSVEHAPGLWAIAQQYPMHEWASALVRSDQMQALIPRLNGKGRLDIAEPESLWGILESLA